MNKDKENLGNIIIRDLEDVKVCVDCAIKYFEQEKSYSLVGVYRNIAMKMIDISCDRAKYESMKD